MQTKEQLSDSAMLLFRLHHLRFFPIRDKTCLGYIRGDILFMRIMGNILWIIFGGFISFLGWIIIGCAWCVTIIGIPVGLQCFKLSSISLNPFGKEVRYEGGPVSFLLNVAWFFFGGAELALGNFIIGILLYITIVGIPFGKQFFKIAKLSLCPFGAAVERVYYL